MTDPGTHPPMTCEDVAELSGLYVLDALEADERAALEAHLATCAEAHDEVRELGGVVPALAMSVEPIDAPAELKARVLSAVANEAAGAQGSRAAQVAATRSMQPGRFSVPSAESPRDVVFPARAAWRAPVWASWGGALAALIVVAVVGVWGLGAGARAERAERRATVLSEAIAAMSAPDSSIAILRDTRHADASGFAALAADGSAYLVMVGLPSAPAGMTYQAWYIADAAPVSAGLLSVDEDGYLVHADDEALAGTRVVALSVEPVAGSIQPTSDPFVVGELRPA